jgi:hypothetical protein
MKRTCYNERCGKTIRSNSKRAIYLGFLRATPKGGAYEAWVCSKKCLDDYNQGDVIPEQENQT